MDLYTGVCSDVTFPTTTFSSSSSCLLSPPPGTWQGVDIWLVFADPLLTLLPIPKESKALGWEMAHWYVSSAPLS